jgi:hypothetical protein
MLNLSKSPGRSETIRESGRETGKFDIMTTKKDSEGGKVCQIDLWIVQHKASCARVSKERNVVDHQRLNRVVNSTPG